MGENTLINAALSEATEGKSRASPPRGNRCYAATEHIAPQTTLKPQLISHKCNIIPVLCAFRVPI
jgi:hypothetical protein